MRALRLANCVWRAEHANQTAASCIQDRSLSGWSPPNSSSGMRTRSWSLAALAESPSIAKISTDKSPALAADLHSSDFKLSRPKICRRPIFGVSSSLSYLVRSTITGKRGSDLKRKTASKCDVSKLPIKFRSTLKWSWHRLLTCGFRSKHIFFAFPKSYLWSRAIGPILSRLTDTAYRSDQVALCRKK